MQTLEICKHNLCGFFNLACNSAEYSFINSSLFSLIAENKRFVIFVNSGFTV